MGGVFIIRFNGVGVLCVVCHPGILFVILVDSVAKGGSVRIRYLYQGKNGREKDEGLYRGLCFY